MGTPEFAVPSLSALMQSGGHEILLVVTQPDKPQGRGMHLQSPPVKATAVQSGLEVLQPASLKGAAALKDMLISSRLDAVIVVAYGKMIPEDWLPITRLGFINIHASLLPELRGGAHQPGHHRREEHDGHQHHADRGRHGCGPRIQADVNTHRR